MLQVEDKNSPLSLYFHIGFCESKCPYCDFMSQKIPKEGLKWHLWVQEYKQALAFYLPFTTGRTITTIYFGGGTPSLVPPEVFDELLAEVKSNYNVIPNAEITAEANPSSITGRKLKEWKDLGINRVSLGVQSFDDEVLQFLGRRHTAAEARAALGQVAEHFDNYSFDMIYAYPSHTVAKWREQLEAALCFGAPHMSLYELTIASPSRFYRLGVKGLDEETAAELYLATLEIMERAGLPWYEVSNFAKAGAESRHNLAYWRGQEYIGIGPSAHGRVRGADGAMYEARQRHYPWQWFRAAEIEKNAIWRRLSPLERREEKLLMQIRTREGAELELVNIEQAREMQEKGLLRIEKGRVVLTPAGLLIMDALVTDLL